MNMYRFPLAGRFNGKDELTGAGSAVLHGISIPELVEAMGGDVTDVNNQPLEMRQLGRRRLREAQARNGSAHLADALYYWALQLWGDRVTVVHDNVALTVHLTTEDPDIARWFAGDGIEQWVVE